jgi:EAL domain-containing protein (putative c-di-GMP-specific phosphodiesterase class I)
MFSEDLSLPSRVCFEITETTLISDIQKARELMTKLNELGFSFAIDDFGAGFSSFNYFGKLPIQYLKIDGSYIMKLEEEPTNQAVVRGVNLIAHQLNIRTIAEHVESAATLAVLADLKVDFAQGYFVGKPIPWK